MSLSALGRKTDARSVGVHSHGNRFVPVSVFLCNKPATATHALQKRNSQVNRKSSQKIAILDPKVFHVPKFLTYTLYADT